MMPTISIIGCGWMGWPCAKHLLAAGYTVKGTTTSEDKLALLKQDGIQGFLLNLDVDEIPLDLLDCDILFITFPPGRGAENLISRYQKRIEKVLVAAKQSGLQKIIYASTTGVYAADPQQAEIDEKSIPVPVRKSAQAMYAAEQALSTYTKQLTILRFAGLVGPGRKAAQFFAGKQNLPNPDNTVNLVHLDDCVQVVSQIIEQQHFGDLLNVVADKHPTRSAYYTQLTKAADLTPPIFAAQNASPNKMVSNAKVKSKLGYTFKYSDPYTFPV